MGISRRFKLVLGIIIPIFGFFLMSQNTFALTKDYNAFSFMYNTPQSATYVSSGLLGYNQPRWNMHSIRESASKITSVDRPANANYLSYTAKYNLLTWTDGGNVNYLPSDVGDLRIYSVSVNGTSFNFESANVSRIFTDFRCDPLSSGISTNCRTITFQISFVLKNIPSTINDVVVGIDYGSSGSLFTGYSLGFNAYYEPDSRNYVSIDFAYDYTSALLQQQIQQQELTINIMNEQTTIMGDYTDAQYDAVDNISGQSSSDMPNSSDQQTTNLIGIISGFITTISGLNLNGNCNLTLPFPQFVGGSKVVNICSGRDYMSVTGVLGYDINLISIFGRFMLICFFVPICFILLRMIYKEIRSWTNG